jgi:hypothetical protein
MRRVAVAVAALAVAPSAHAATCGVTATGTHGAAPLTVTYTASCASSAYSWSFGDGTTATGQTVQHTFAAGRWTATLTSDAGLERAPAATAIAVRLRGPRIARYAQWVTLHATVVPRAPVTLRGRRFVAGKLRVRILGTAPWVALAAGVRSNTVRIRVRPTMTIRFVGRPLVGEPLRVVATLHPATSGTIPRVPAIDTRAPHVVHVRVTSRPTYGWTAARATAQVAIVSPNLSLGARGASVRTLEDRLAELHYAVMRDGYFGDDDLEAVYAFQKVEGLARTGSVDADVWARLLTAHVPLARYGGDHVEIDKTRQVLFVVRRGKVTLVVATSTGATGNTPAGVFHVYRKVVGFDWVLYYPSYWFRGFAVHGYPDVPPYPASHGCSRIPMWIAQTVYRLMPEGSAVYVYAS